MVALGLAGLGQARLGTAKTEEREKGKRKAIIVYR